jgi:hypothetical protein
MLMRAVGNKLAHFLDSVTTYLLKPGRNRYTSYVMAIRRYTVTAQSATKFESMQISKRLQGFIVPKI